MKRILLVVACIAAAVGAYAADGSLNFANKVTAAGLDAPVKNADNSLLAGAGFTAQIYAGADANSLSPTALTAPFKVNGYFSAGKVLIPGFGEGKDVFIAIAAFDNTGNKTSYEAAKAAGLNAGMSAPIKVTLGGDNLVPPATPANLVGLASFSLSGGVVIPEPTTLALSALAAGALLLFRRK